jgi:hypothetical protein
MSRLATALAAALRSPGVEEPAASVAAETGLAIFRVAFANWVDEQANWVDEQNDAGLEDLIGAALHQLAVIAPGQ